jgi:hypothetical protein
MLLKAPVICTCDGVLSPDAIIWVRTAACILDMQRWHLLHGVSLQTPSAVQVSRPVLAIQAQALVAVALLQNSPPALLQSVSSAQVPAGLVMLSTG